MYGPQPVRMNNIPPQPVNPIHLLPHNGYPSPPINALPPQEMYEYGAPPREEVQYVGRKKFARETIKTYPLDRSTRDPRFVSQLPEYQRLLQTLAEGFSIFNAVITLMGITFSFRKTIIDVSSSAVSLLSTVQYVAVYFPLVFFLLYIPLFNNFFSENMWYKFLRHGAIVDFQNTHDPKQWFLHYQPIFFLIAFVGYLVIMLYFFVEFGASWTTFLTFLTNLIAGIFFCWYRAQGIENRFISLSEFIQSFPNNEGDFGDIDHNSLTGAVSLLSTATRLECPEPCYGPFMRRRYYATHFMGLCRRLSGYMFLLGIIAVVITGAVVSFQRELQDVNRDNFNNYVRPCILVCEKQYQDMLQQNVKMPGRDLCSCSIQCIVTSNSQSNGACESEIVLIPPAGSWRGKCCEMANVTKTTATTSVLP